MLDEIKIVDKPDWISWDDIHEVIWKSHSVNRIKGVYMKNAEISGGIIQDKIEKNSGKMYIALVNKNLIGTAAVYIKNVSLWCWQGKCAYCCFASVLPEYRGYGIYKLLSSMREKEVRAMGFNCMIFNTHEHNKRIIDVNIKNGYKLVDISISNKYYSVVMMKWLDGCPYSDWYINLQFFIRKCYKKLRFKPERIKRFGI